MVWWPSVAASKKKVVEPSITEITDVESLVEIVELSKVEYFELAAVRNEVERNDAGDEIAPSYTLNIRHDSGGIAVRLRIELSTRQGEIRVDAAVLYETPGHQVKIAQAAGVDFANKVGIMTLVPYLREAIASLSLRVFGEPILMPIIRQGALQFEFNSEDSDGPGM